VLGSRDLLFTKCGFANALYVEVFKWLGLVIEIMEKITNLLEIFYTLARKGKWERGVLLGWHTSFWLIWIAKNVRVVYAKLTKPTKVVEEIKRLSYN